MHPFLKYFIAALSEVMLIAALFWSVDSVSLNSKPTFTELDAIFWTFISIIGFGFVIYWLKRTA